MVHAKEHCASAAGSLNMQFHQLSGSKEPGTEAVPSINSRPGHSHAVRSSCPDCMQVTDTLTRVSAGVLARSSSRLCNKHQPLAKDATSMVSRSIPGMLRTETLGTEAVHGQQA